MKSSSTLSTTLIIGLVLSLGVPIGSVQASLPSPDGDSVDLSDPSVRDLVQVPPAALAVLTPGGDTPGVTNPSPEAVTAVVPIGAIGRVVQVSLRTSAGPVSLSFTGATGLGSGTPEVTATVVPSPTDSEATRGILAQSERIRLVANNLSFSSVEVCVPYNRPALLGATSDLDRFRLVHFSAAGERDITTATVRSGTDWQICGLSSTFSEFQGVLLAGSRLAGSNRYGTAAAVAREVAPNGARRVLVASGEDYVDGLIAGLAAARSNAPLVLVRPNSLPSETAAALASLRPREIQIVGGPTAVNLSVATTLATRTGATVTRVGGANRYATAADLMKISFPSGARTVLLVSGQSFADALAAGAVAANENAAMLLTSPTQLPAATRDALTTLKPERIIIVGGTSAVSAAVMQAASEYGQVFRIGGADRYATSAILAARFASASHIVAVTGRNFPDGIVATSLAGRRGAPILLVNGDALTSPVNVRLRAIRAQNLFVLGGRNAVGANAELTLVRGLVSQAAVAL
jgi:putative cell wall-binding protein